MIERDLQGDFDATQYALSKLRDEDREILIQFDDFCESELIESGLKYSPEVAERIEKDGYKSVVGSEEAIKRWKDLLEEGAGKKPTVK